MRQKFKTTFKRTQNFLNDAYRFVLKIVNPALFTLSAIGIVIAIYDFGFFHSDEDTNFAQRVSLRLLQIFTVLFILRFILVSLTQKLWRLAFLDVVFAVFAFFLSGVADGKIEFEVAWLSRVATSDALRWIFFVLIFLFEIGRQSLNLNKLNLRPEQLFIFSFLILILIGTGLLMLPRSTHEGIRFIDALFTATSAVCVTGLIVVDTATYFTPIGQWVIFTLFQLGGIGIMTFTSFFGLFQKGGASFQDQLMLKSITNSEKMGEVFKTLLKIVFITILIELLGLVFLLSTTPVSNFDGVYEWVTFALFHSVSAFCNAGFSILSDGYADGMLAQNYYSQMVIVFLIFFGSIGFPVLFNIYQFGKHKILNLSRKYIRHKRTSIQTNIINLTTRLAVQVSIILVVSGTLIFYLLEKNNAFAEHSGIGKVVSALFASVTSRTAGLNTIDYSTFGVPAIMIMILLMWIGASPYSTGGGIKVTTFALAIMNLKSIATGTQRIDVHYRSISQESVSKAFVVIFMSFLIIGAGVMLVSLFDPHIPYKNVVFECFSAYSTVGLSLGATGEIGNYSKFVITVLMFVGRMGTLTLLVSIFKNMNQRKYKYPKENLMIT